jgi:hypothetical protein
MQKSFSPIIAGCVVLAAIICTAPKSASATVGAAPAIHYGEIDANMVQEVGRRYWRGRRYVRPYAYGYGYRPYGYYGYSVDLTPTIGHTLTMVVPTLITVVMATPTGAAPE